MNKTGISMEYLLKRKGQISELIVAKSATYFQDHKAWSFQATAEVKQIILFICPNTSH